MTALSYDLFGQERGTRRVQALGKLVRSNCGRVEGKKPSRGAGELVIAMVGTRQVTDQVRFGDGLDDMLGTARRMDGLR